MARRGVGYSSLQRHIDSANSYSTLSSSLAESQTKALSAQLATFQAALSSFSTHHRHKILSSPDFRSRFSQLCAQLGVDPLGGGAKGLWDKMGVGDWYYLLGVQIVDVCLRTRERGGGLVGLEEVIKGVMKLRGAGHVRKNTTADTSKSIYTLAKKSVTTSDAVTEITRADIEKAIETLEPLGCGYALVSIGGQFLVRCYPGGLDRDSITVVEAGGTQGNGTGCVTLQDIWNFTAKGGEKSGWTVQRIERAVEKAVMEDGLIWVDDQAGLHGEARQYWIPSLFDFA